MIPMLNICTYYSIDTIYHEILKNPKYGWQRSILRFLIDSKKFIKVLERFYTKDPHFLQTIVDIGGVHYDKSVEFTMMDYDETILILDYTCFEAQQRYISNSDSRWDKFKHYVDSKLPTMMQLPNGIIVEFNLKYMNATSRKQYIFYKFKRVFYHPDYEFIRTALNNMAKKLYSKNNFSLRCFVECVRDYRVIEYFDISSLIMLIYYFDTSLHDLKQISRLICQKYWTTLSTGITKIMENICVVELMEFLEYLLFTKIKFKQFVASKFFNVLIKKLKESPQNSISGYPIFFRLCCYSNSFELAECAKNIGYLSRISYNIENNGVKEVELTSKWHKYFVKARLDELIEQSKEYVTDLPYIEHNESVLGKHDFRSKIGTTRWVNRNINKKYYNVEYLNTCEINVTKTKEFEICINKEKIVSEIDNLKAKYPYLYIGKRVMPPSKKEPNHKENKIN